MAFLIVFLSSLIHSLGELLYLRISYFAPISFHNLSQIGSSFYDTQKVILLTRKVLKFQLIFYLGVELR